MSATTLGALLYTFFETHLKAQKGVRAATVKSYRDAVRLFLLFVARDCSVRVSGVGIEDLTAERVRRFLSYLESERHNHVHSRNQRLAALKTFFDFLAVQAPEYFVEAEGVMAIPVKRAPPPPTLFLERDEVQALFANLPSAGPRALRDRTLLLFLYNTGARAQEVAELHRSHLELAQHRVRLHGKGDKWRMCPLWEETISLLAKLISQQVDAADDGPVFRSQRGQALTRFGIYKIVRHHTRTIGKRGCDGQPVAIGPHVLRHTVAVHLLEAGVEVNVIRAWLGHASLETTNRYAEIDITMKQAAMQACAPPTSSTQASEFPNQPMWRDAPALLAWLQSL
jgi:site-specific recombinase XerD